jgi:thymidylate synthase
MREIYIKGNNLTDSYHQALLALAENGELSNCPDYNQKQRECSMTFYVENAIAEPRISKLIIGGAAELQQYVLEVLDGILNFRIGNGWNYTYNSRIMTQYDFIIRELKRNPSSRRAVIDVRDWKYDSKDGNDSPACLQNLQYFIRNNKLDCCVLFRSNDLPEATFFNAFALIKLQEEIASELGVEVGSYTHRANSMHCYEKDFKLLDGFVNGIKTKSLDDLTYNYEEFYKELMDESIPAIMKQVEVLKQNLRKD